MNSVPRVGERWTKGVRMTEAETREYTMTCCRFSNRCPYAPTNAARASRKCASWAADAACCAAIPA